MSRKLWYGKYSFVLQVETSESDKNSVSSKYIRTCTRKLTVSWNELCIIWEFLSYHSDAIGTDHRLKRVNQRIRHYIVILRVLAILAGYCEATSTASDMKLLELSFEHYSSKWQVESGQSDHFLVCSNYGCARNTHKLTASWDLIVKIWNLLSYRLNTISQSDKLNQVSRTIPQCAQIPSALVVLLLETTAGILQRFKWWET